MKNCVVIFLFMLWIINFIPRILFVAHFLIFLDYVRFDIHCILKEFLRLFTLWGNKNCIICYWENPASSVANKIARFVETNACHILNAITVDVRLSFEKREGGHCHFAVYAKFSSTTFTAHSNNYNNNFSGHCGVFCGLNHKNDKIHFSSQICTCPLFIKASTIARLIF